MDLEQTNFRMSHLHNVTITWLAGWLGTKYSTFQNRDLEATIELTKKFTNSGKSPNVLNANYVQSSKISTPIYFSINFDLAPNFWVLSHNQHIFYLKKFEFNSIQ